MKISGSWNISKYLCCCSSVSDPKSSPLQSQTKAGPAMMSTIVPSSLYTALFSCIPFRESLSCVEARAYDAGNDNYRLRVWNSGNTTAYNISASIDGNPTVRIIDQGKQPFEELASNKSYELILLTANGSIPKITVITEWYDENDVKHTKRQVLDI